MSSNRFFHLLAGFSWKKWIKVQGKGFEHQFTGTLFVIDAFEGNHKSKKPCRQAHTKREYRQGKSPKKTPLA